MGIANDLMEAVHEAQAIAAKAVEQRDELAEALREIDARVGDAAKHKAEAVRGYLDDIRNYARAALAKLGDKP